MNVCRLPYDPSRRIEIAVPPKAMSFADLCDIAPADIIPMRTRTLYMREATYKGQQVQARYDEETDTLYLMDQRP